VQVGDFVKHKAMLLDDERGLHGTIVGKVWTIPPHEIHTGNNGRWKFRVRWTWPYLAKRTHLFLPENLEVAASGIKVPETF
jgi:hypothetical protein